MRSVLDPVGLAVMGMASSFMAGKRAFEGDEGLFLGWIILSVALLILMEVRRWRQL